jgi:hypothetical protein
MVIDAARGITLPDAQLANSEIFYVEEQVLNASRAKAHALIIIPSREQQVKERGRFLVLLLHGWQGVALVPTAAKTG